MSQFRSLRRRVAMVGVSAAAVFAVATTVAPAANAMPASVTVTAQHVTQEPVSLKVDWCHRRLVDVDARLRRLLDVDAVVGRLARIDIDV